VHREVWDVGKIAETRHSATESAGIADGDVLHVVPRPRPMDSVCPIQYDISMNKWLSSAETVPMDMVPNNPKYLD
jgi:hypothetical protein